MTNEERKLAKHLKELNLLEDVYLHSHTSPDGINRVKLKTKSGRPLNIITRSVYHKLNRDGYVYSEKNTDRLLVENLITAVDLWNERKAKRDAAKKNKRVKLKSSPTDIF